MAPYPDDPVNLKTPLWQALYYQLSKIRTDQNSNGYTSEPTQAEHCQTWHCRAGPAIRSVNLVC